MKRVFKACRKFRLDVWLVGLVGCCLCLASSAVFAAAGQEFHITQAEMMQAPGNAAAPVTTTINPATFTGPWNAVALPHSYLGRLLPANRQPAHTTTWYRVHLPALKSSGGTFHLYLLRWQILGQIAIYGDNRLLYRSPGSDAWNLFMHPALFVPLNLAADGPTPQTVFIRVDSAMGSGAAISSLWVGDSDSLYRRYITREWIENRIPSMSAAAFLAVGLFALVVWMRRREPLYLWFAALTLFTVMRRLFFYGELESTQLPDNWFDWATLNALVWQVVTLHFFLGVVHGRRHPWLSRVLVGAGLICTILTLPTPLLMHSVAQFKPMLQLGVIIAALVVIIVGYVSSRRAGSRDGELLAIGYFLFLLLGIHDWMKSNTLLLDMESMFLMPYVLVSQFLLSSYVMFRRYIGAMEEVKRVNAGLETRLRAREAELAASYASLRVIEQREMLNLERRRLMQDMHDGLGSSLMWALRGVEHGKLEAAALADVLKDCIDDLKLTIDSIEPIETDLLLLLATFRFRIEPRLESVGIALRWEVQAVPALSWLEPRSTLHILRIMQEAFANVIKHTTAKEIRVTTGVEVGGVVVTIADNGGGFAFDQALLRGGQGLSNQQRRAKAIGGRLTWQSTAQGTDLSLWLPS